ncbi:phasin family protein [Bradyrhizobium sp. Tv2a-2]|uniref:phasin family protein n=1 Tax=Bradyrhizobium sp. Tv2a-2 TaxID=113395 RepID=UPI000464AC8A|nr:phasin family protein [Bradyrhizobium sp. Tv2a-2]
MSKTRNRRPTDDNAVRRSLVELTAAVRQAVEDGLLEVPASRVAALAEHPRLERATEKPEQTDTPEPPIAPIRTAAAEPPKKQASRGRESVASGSAAEMMVQIAKDYQNNVLDSIKAGLNAALDHAKDFAETKRAGEAAGDIGPANDGVNALDAAVAFRAEAIVLMQANVAATVNYARDLAGTRTAAEFVELTATQARKSCELMLKQADAVKSLGQAVAKDRTERKG